MKHNPSLPAGVQAMQEAEQRYWKSCCRLARERNGARCPVCRSNLPYYALASTLRLGDIVVTGAAGGQSVYSHATVKKIEDRQVHLVRPYVVTAAFTYTGGVITSLGYEEYSIGLDDYVLVLQESTVRDVMAHETDEGRLIRSGEQERRRFAAQQENLARLRQEFEARHDGTDTQQEHMYRIELIVIDDGVPQVAADRPEVVKAYPIGPSFNHQGSAEKVAQALVDMMKKK